jgi:hypothetical protein
MHENKTPVQELQLPQQREDTTGILYLVLMSDTGLEKHISRQAWVGVILAGYNTSY